MLQKYHFFLNDIFFKYFFVKHFFMPEAIYRKRSAFGETQCLWRNAVP